MDFGNRTYNSEKSFLKAFEKGSRLDPKKMHKELRDNPAIMLKLVSKDGELLQYASRRLRDDSDIVKAAVTECADALQYASSRLRDDYYIVKAAVTKNAFALRHAGPTQCNCDEIIKIISNAETGSATALTKGNPRFRSNKEIIFNILQNSGDLHFVTLIHDDLQSDEKFMFKLINLQYMHMLNLRFRTLHLSKNCIMIMLSL